MFKRKSALRVQGGYQPFQETVPPMPPTKSKEAIIPLKDINVELLAHQCLCEYVKEDIVKTIDLMEQFVKLGAMQSHIQFDLGNAYVTIELKESED